MTRIDDRDPLTDVTRSPDDFYRALGYALVAFTEIDGALFMLFCALTSARAPDIESARRVFYESWNFAVRLALVARTARERIRNSRLRAEWDEIEEQLSALKDDRNNLAHASAAASFEMDPSLGLALVPMLHLPLGTVAAESADKLDARSLVLLAIEFEDAADRIGAFVRKIAPHMDDAGFSLRTGDPRATRRRGA